MLNGNMFFSHLMKLKPMCMITDLFSISVYQLSFPKIPNKRHSFACLINCMCGILAGDIQRIIA